ncbi:MAG: Gfo/Idh/MocA family oxidoreductase [Candidatus Omnitrophota bacterium]
MKIGFIGYRGHATRLLKVFDEHAGCEITHIYHPDKIVDVKRLGLRRGGNVAATRHLKDLCPCDAVVISSPNHTHFGYLKKLIKGYKGYVFCEKPPVSSLKEIRHLENFSARDKKRIYFNFNMRFSFLGEILKMFPARYDLGEIVRASILGGHGLAFKEEYRTSWRAKRGLHTAGVLETLGIHYFDLFVFLFGSPKNVWYQAARFSPNGDSADTGHLACRFENQLCLNLSCSYSIPFADHLQITYTNGFIDYDAGNVRVFGPRETFDKNGLFIPPPLIHAETIDKNQLYSDSLKKSCGYFIGRVLGKKDIERRYFEQSVLSNKICLSAARQRIG